MSEIILEFYNECACFVTDYCRWIRNTEGHAERMKYDIISMAKLVDKAKKQHPEWEWENDTP